MRFFVDETSFVCPAGIDIAMLERHLGAFVELVDSRHVQHDDVFRWSGLIEGTEVQPGVTLVDVLYQHLEHLPIDLTVRLGLQQALNRCLQWDDRIAIVPDPHVEIDAMACTAPTVALVHARMSAGHGGVCLTLGLRGDRSRVSAVRAEGRTHDVHFVSAERQLPAFFRTLFEIEDMPRDEYMANAPDAFPELGFVPGLAAQLARFETTYREVRPIVTEHLAALNDHFLAIFQRHDGKPSETQRELGAACHVDASPEGPKTHANKKAMKEREVVVDELLVGRRRLSIRRTISCEWHTKIKPNTDRIHFHPGIDKPKEIRKDEHANEKLLIVGMFVDHLTT